MENLFFDRWESIIRTIVMTVLAYFFLVICLRSFGKRTPAKVIALNPERTHDNYISVTKIQVDGQ